MNLSDHKILVYEAVNAINGKRYIGITKKGLGVRKRRHIQTSRSGCGSYFGAALRKHGQDNFTFRPLIICPDFQYMCSKTIRKSIGLRFNYVDKP